MNDRACEVCGGPATTELIDAKEEAPVKDAAGTLWATWAVDGPPHHFCTAPHPGAEGDAAAGSVGPANGHKRAVMPGERAGQWLQTEPEGPCTSKKP